MSLSLVPDYASSSDSDSESESKAPISQTQQPVQPVSALDSMISRILPPPKNAGATTKKRIQIMVDLPPPRSSLQPPTANETPKPVNTVGTSGKSVFAELSSMMPAPKNTKLPAKQQPAQDKSTASSLPKSDGLLIPHSLANKRKSKAKPVVSQPKTPTVQSADSTDADGDSKPSHVIDKPFFTFGGDIVADSAHHDDSGDYEEIEGQGVIDKPETGDRQLGMVYDPTSGYYYDSASGAYYYFDPNTNSYVDAQSLFESPAADSRTLHEDDLRSIDNQELEQLIGRRELRRGEASMGAIKTVSRETQLAGSGYSDAQAAAEYSAKRAQAHRPGHIIAGDVSKQKKQKHNIMYLAHQAQEQGDVLRERHANRQQAKKAAKSKYGY
ncbi:hypothetical protein LPJ62_003816 [Coemansia sp. RSA 2167]|nr:hypothetical protein LPJ58_002863 [Coemansia sp. RSA 1591]KAJ1786382.1 hypothetical protein LPJ62_003816 [Coemansia sp. RSA 2167]